MGICAADCDDVVRGAVLGFDEATVTDVAVAAIFKRPQCRQVFGGHQTDHDRISHT